jgi:hypothetical protein
MSSDPPDTPDEDIPQDPGIPGYDVVSDPRDRPTPDAGQTGAEERERPDDPDDEGHMTAPEDG